MGTRGGTPGVRNGEGGEERERERKTAGNRKKEKKNELLAYIQ